MLTGRRLLLAAGLLLVAAVLGVGLLGARAGSDPALSFDNPETLALARAIAAGDEAAVRALAGGGASLARQGKDGITLLQWSMLEDRPDMLRLLLELGADPAQIGYNGMTALHAAAGAQGKPFLRILLESGANPDLRDGRTEAPVIDQALMTGNRDAVFLLLADKANPNLADRQGDTPLHVAAQISDYGSLLVLLEAGADPTIRNRAGQTFAPFFAITPKESMLNSETKAARQAVRDWLDDHGYAEVLQ